jgi:alpha-beta hydrolase superfamily lysophospholipase
MMTAPMNPVSRTVSSVRADEIHYATTRDGWKIALHRYRARGARRRHAVVCCHGLGANHLAFDAAPSASPARHLASRGYDTFLLDLRGHGASDHPSFRGEKRFGWTFDDYLRLDLPSAVELVEQLAGRGRVHWIGHSMGGLLLYAHLASGGSSSIRSGITVASSLDYSGTDTHLRRLLPLRPIAERVPAIPIGPVARTLAKLVGHVRTPFEQSNVWSSNIDPTVWKRIQSEGFHWVSARVLLQLATALEAEGLRSSEGELYASKLGAATAPVFALAGDRDAQCPFEAVKRTFDALGSSRRELKVFGKTHGHVDHYGHFDLLAGRRARDEVYPHIDAWLDEHDA